MSPEPSRTLENEVIVAGGHSPGGHHDLGSPCGTGITGVGHHGSWCSHGPSVSLYKALGTVAPGTAVPGQHFGADPSEGSAPMMSGSTGSGSCPKPGTSGLGRVGDLAVVVGAAGRARDVGLLRVTAARAVDQHRARRLPLGTAGPGVAPRHLPLRDGHFNPPGSPPRSREVAYLVTPRAVAGRVCSGRRRFPVGAARDRFTDSLLVGLLRDVAKCFPTRVDTVAVTVVRPGVGELDTALGAQAGAVRAAQR